MLADIIPKIAQMETKESKFRPRPSMAGPERCLRQMVYHGLGVPRQPLSGRAALVFDDSSWHEELTRDWIAKTAFRIHSQQMQVECRPPMTVGHIDGIITDVTGVDRLLEHKALNHFTFNRFWGVRELPLDYFTQVAIYLDGLMKDVDISQALLLIKNKNTAQYIEFLCEYDKESDTLKILERTASTGERHGMDISIHNIVGDACDKFNLALDYIQKKKLPKRQYDIDHWRCEYCQWHKPCWANYEKEFQELTEDAQLTEEIATAVRFYRELGAQKKEIEKEYNKLRATIMAALKKMNAKKGSAGEYIIERKLVQGSRLDKSKIPENILAAASTPYQYERLFVKNLNKEV